jgi:hypothetical protein
MDSRRRRGEQSSRRDLPMCFCFPGTALSLVPGYVQSPLRGYFNQFMRIRVPSVSGGISRTRREILRLRVASLRTPPLFGSSVSDGDEDSRRRCRDCRFPRALFAPTLTRDPNRVAKEARRDAAPDDCDWRRKGGLFLWSRYAEFGGKQRPTLRKRQKREGWGTRRDGMSERLWLMDQGRNL